MRRGRKRPYGEEHVPLDIERVRGRGGARTEVDAQGREWTVRTVRGGEKRYRCPGCGGDIPPGVPHLVAWTEDHLFGADAGLAERRHWHTQCWASRR